MIHIASRVGKAYIYTSFCFVFVLCWFLFLVFVGVVVVVLLLLGFSLSVLWCSVFRCVLGPFGSSVCYVLLISAGWLVRSPPLVFPHIARCQCCLLCLVLACILETEVATPPVFNSSETFFSLSRARDMWLGSLFNKKKTFGSKRP